MICRVVADGVVQMRDGVAYRPAVGEVIEVSREAAEHLTQLGLIEVEEER